MYWSKTKQQKNKKTRGEKIGSFYYKLVPVQNTKTQKNNILKQQDDTTDKKRSQQNKH